MTVKYGSALEVADELGPDSDATVKMPRPIPEDDAATVDVEEQEFDPERTLVRDDWESTVIRRVAPHVVAVQSQVAEDSGFDSRFGWESEGIRRLAHELQKNGA